MPCAPVKRPGRMRTPTRRVIIFFSPIVGDGVERMIALVGRMAPPLAARQVPAAWPGPQPIRPQREAERVLTPLLEARCRSARHRHPGPSQDRWGVVRPARRFARARPVERAIPPTCAASNRCATRSGSTCPLMAEGSHLTRYGSRSGVPRGRRRYRVRKPITGPSTLWSSPCWQILGGRNRGARPTRLPPCLIVVA